MNPSRLPTLPALRRGFAASLAVALAAFAGCGPAPTAEVTGSVSYQGKPVGAGSVVVTSVADASKMAVGQLSSEGKFRVVGAPSGPVHIHIDTSGHKPRPSAGGPAGGNYPKGGSSGPPPGGPPSGPPKGAGVQHMGSEGPDVVTAGKYVAIPEKYEKADTSGLDRTLNAGANDVGTLELTGDVKK